MRWSVPPWQSTHHAFGNNACSLSQCHKAVDRLRELHVVFSGAKPDHFGLTPALIAIRSSSRQTGSGCSSKPLVASWITPCPARQAGPTWTTLRSRPLTPSNQRRAGHVRLRAAPSTSHSSAPAGSLREGGIGLRGLSSSDFEYRLGANRRSKLQEPNTFSHRRRLTEDRGLPATK